MKYKMIYGSKDDDFIWKMIPTYSLLEKLHLKLAKWHLRKLIKVDEKILDKLWLEYYNNIIKKINEEPLIKYTYTEEEFIEALKKFSKTQEKYLMSSDEIQQAIEESNKMWYETDRPILWGTNINPMCNAVVKLKGDSDEVE